MSQLEKSAKSIGLIVIISLGSKVLGFFRQALIASRYGSGAGTDTFFIALSAISLFSVILTQTINTTLIPILSDVEVHEGKEGKRNHFNNFLNTLTLAAILLSVVAFFTAPYVMKVLARGFKGEQFQHAVSMMRLGLPILILSTLVGSFRGYLQSEEMFLESELAHYPWNLVHIFFLLFLAKYFTITGLMITAIVAEASRLLIPIPSLRRLDYRYEWTIDLKDKYMRQMAYLVPPVLFSVGISDLNRIVDRSMASSLPAGSISSLSYAGTLRGIVHSIFIAAIITVVFPLLSKEANAKNYDQLKKIGQTSMNVILLILIPTMIGMAILSKPIVMFAYQRGQFDAQSARMTQTALLAYLVGLVGTGITALLIRVFHALQDTKTPMMASLYGLILNIGLNILFVRIWQHNGLALATSVTAILGAVYLLYSLRKKIGPLGLRNIIESSLKILFSSVVMGFMVYFAYTSLLNLLDPTRLIELFIVIATVGLGIGVYLMMLYLLKVKELHFLIHQIKERMN